MRTGVIYVYSLKTQSFYMTLDICPHGTARDIELAMLQFGVLNGDVNCHGKKQRSL